MTSSTTPGGTLPGCLPVPPPEHPSPRGTASRQPGLFITLSGPDLHRGRGGWRLALSAKPPRSRCPPPCGHPRCLMRWRIRPRSSRSPLYILVLALRCCCRNISSRKLSFLARNGSGLLRVALLVQLIQNPALYVLHAHALGSAPLPLGKQMLSSFCAPNGAIKDRAA